MEFSKMLFCFALAAGMVCGFSACGGLGIEKPDLTTEYVESGFLEYRMIYDGSVQGDLPGDAICVNSSCAYRTLREVDETAENIEVGLYFGGGVNAETPIVSMEVYISGGYSGERIQIRSIPKAEYVTEEYKIDCQTVYHEDKNYYEAKTEYHHTERVYVPMSYLWGESGAIRFCTQGIGEDDRLVYGATDQKLYYTRENGKIHFMSEREYAYVTDGSLIY